MVWRIDDGGVVDLFLHYPKENIRSDPYLYVDHNLVAILVTLVAILEHSCSRIIFSIYLK